MHVLYVTESDVVYNQNQYSKDFTSSAGAAFAGPIEMSSKVLGQ